MSDDVFINELMATGVSWETATLLGKLESDIQLIPTGGDDSGLIQNAMYAAAATGRSVSLSTGTFLLLNGLVWPVGFTGLIGAGPNSTVLRRMGPVSNMITAVGCSAFSVANLCLDGNKTFNAIPSNGMIFNGCSDFQAYGVRIINQKTGTNYGDGIQLINTPATNTTGRGIIFDTCQCCDNDQSGLHVVATGAGIQVQGGIYSNNTLNGVYFDRGATPVVNTMPDVTINAVRAERNTSGGIVITGFLVLGLGSVYTYGHGNDPACGVTVTANQANYNAGYGIFVQATGGAITGNSCRYNGTTNQAGINCSAQGLTITGNSCEYNTHFGIDAGGSWSCDINDNIIRYNNGNPSTVGIGINIGACQHVNCCNNTLENNFQNAILCTKNDSGAFYFPWDAVDITIDNNLVINTNSTAIGGILVSANPSDIFITNNRFVWPDTTGSQTLSPQISSGTIRGNTLVGASTPGGFASAGATTITIPDICDTVLITSTTTVTSILTFQQSTFSGLVTSANMTNLGSGYTSAPTVTPSGSWSVAPTFTAQLTQDGRVACVLVTTRGAAVTGSVTLAFSGGGGSGAAATCTVGVTPPNGRNLTIIGSGSVANIQSNSSILLDLPSGLPMILQANFALSLTSQSGIYSQTAANPTNVAVQNNTGVRFYDTSGNFGELILQNDNNLILYGSDATGALRALFTSAQHSSVSGFNIQIATGLATASSNSVQVQGNAAGTPAKILAVAQSDADQSLEIVGKGIDGVLIDAFDLAGTPTTTDIRAGFMGIVKNSGDSSVKLYYNDGGSLKSVTLT